MFVHRILYIYNHSDVDRIWDVQRYSHFSEIVLIEFSTFYLLQDDYRISG